MEPLHILVVDAKPTIALPLIDSLRGLGHRAEAQNDGVNAIHAAVTKRHAGKPYHLILAHYEIADLDPLEFLTTLRRHREAAPVCFYADMHSIRRDAFAAIEQLDGRFMSLPIDHGRLKTLVDEIVRGGASRVPGESSGSGDGPFFGTGRVARRSGTESVAQPPTAPPVAPVAQQAVPALPPLPPVPPPPPVPPAIGSGPRQTVRTPLPDDTSPQVLRGTTQFSETASYMRTPRPGSIAVPPTAPVTGRHGMDTTARVRRSVGQSPAVPTNAPPAETGTSRIRRSVTGSIAKPPAPQSVQATGIARVARCQSCGKDFYAEMRPQAYSLPCIHCGQLNRINPQ